MFKVWIDWENPGIKEEVPCYEFGTKAELDAFLEGLTAVSTAYEWNDEHGPHVGLWRVYHSQEEFDAGEFKAAKPKIRRSYEAMRDYGCLVCRSMRTEERLVSITEEESVQGCICNDCFHLERKYEG